MAPPWWPVAEFWLVGLRRVWRGTMLSGVLGPLLNLGAIGVGVGALVDHTGRTAVSGAGRTPGSWPRASWRRRP